MESSTSSRGLLVYVVSRRQSKCERPTQRRRHLHCLLRSPTVLQAPTSPILWPCQPPGRGTTFFPDVHVLCQSLTSSMSASEQIQIYRIMLRIAGIRIRSQIDMLQFSEVRLCIPCYLIIDDTNRVLTVNF
jgi:hypothetical protein